MFAAPADKFQLFLEGQFIIATTDGFKRDLAKKIKIARLNQRNASCVNSLTWVKVLNRSVSWSQSLHGYVLHENWLLSSN